MKACSYSLQAFFVSGKGKAESKKLDAEGLMREGECCEDEPLMLQIRYYAMDVKGHFPI